MTPWALGCVLLTTGAHAEVPSLLERGVVSRAVLRAVRHAGLSADTAREIAGRARAAGWLPQLQVRMVRGLGVSASQTTQAGDTRASTDDSLAFDLRLHFGFDRLAFDPSEVALARVEQDRAERRAALARDVVELLATLERTRLELRAADPASPDAVHARLEFARARARLELLIDASLDALSRTR